MIIAIDGPSASGKGTLAKKLAARYGLAHLDTGALYRAVALKLLKAGSPLEDETAAEQAARALAPPDLDDDRLRLEEIGKAASVVSAMPRVRDALRQFQRDFAARDPGAVLDGRDIGTVICPDADVKLFVTASAAARAKRRAEELRGRGETADEDEIRRDIEARDKRDRERAASPLKQADDAYLLDTTNLDIEAAFEAAQSLIDGALRRG